MRLFLAALALSSLLAADTFKLGIHNNEVWLTVNPESPQGYSRQLTHDGKTKDGAVLGPQGDRLAYIEVCIEAENCTPEVVILDVDGKRLQSFQVRPGIGDNEPCASIMNIAWLPGGNRMGVECHGNPSLSEYAELDVSTGRTIRAYSGLWFTPSPDNRYVAHVGPLMHFAPPPAQSYRLMFNDDVAYPLLRGKKPVALASFDDSYDVVRITGSTAYGIHEFGADFVWAPDSKRVAFLDCTYDWQFEGTDMNRGEAKNNRCGIAVAAPSGAFQRFPLPDQLRAVNVRRISWQSTAQIRVEFKDSPPKILTVRPF